MLVNLLAAVWLALEAGCILLSLPPPWCGTARITDANHIWTFTELQGLNLDYQAYTVSAFTP